MEFVTIRLGGGHRIFAEKNEVRLPFVLPAPAAAVYPMLQSFKFVNTDDDRHLKAVKIRLTPLFNAGVSTTEGQVEIQTEFSDSDGGVTITADAVEMEIGVLVVGV
jgi:hypothetical protein